MDTKDAEKAALALHHQTAAAEDRLAELTDHLTDLEARQRAERARLDALAAASASLLGRIGVNAAAVDHSALRPAVTLSPAELHAIDANLPRFEPLAALTFDSWEDYRGQVDAYTRQHPIDTETDPLLQLLGPRRIAEVNRRFRASFGDTRWTRWDYAAVGVAAALASLVDLLLVRIPQDMTFLGKDYTGSPVTKLLSQTADRMTEGGGDSPLLQWLEAARGKLEGAAKVPWDLSTNSAARGIDVPGLRPALHRLMSPGHDPALGFVSGTLDTLRGVCTLIDRHGKLHVIDNPTHQLNNPFTAFIGVIVHLLSDLTTKAGVQPPFFTLTQLLTQQSGFILKTNGARVTYADAARWMVTHGYTVGHFATMSLVPLLTELILRVYFNLAHFDALYDADAGAYLGAGVKLASMRLMAHSLAASGNFLKMWLYGWNPLAFNHAQLIALATTFLAFCKAEAKRDHAIEAALTEGWERLLAPR